MKKRLMIPALLLIVAILAGCTPQQSNEISDIPTLGSQTAQPNPMDAGQISPTDFTLNLPEGYDPASEEDDDDREDIVFPAAQQGSVQQSTAQQALSIPADNSTASPFAGSSPIPLNPIDMPTPTPRPALTFTYATYTASRLGFTFESVAGYEIDDSSGDTYILREPAGMWKDNKGVVVTLSQAAVSGGYNKSDVRKDVLAKLDEIGQSYQRWEPSNTAERTLLNAPGYYANYRATQMDGTIVRGRIHMAVLPGNRVLTLHIEHPAEYNEDYIGVFTKIRSTLKTI